MIKTIKKIIVIVLLSVILIAVIFLIVSRNMKTDTGVNTESNIPSFREFFPFGRGITTPPLEENDKEDIIVPGETEAVVPRIKQLSYFNTAGAGISNTKKIVVDEATGQTKDELIPVIRYVNRTTGHVYEQKLINGEERRITEINIPGVATALFGNDGKSIIMRYVKEDNKTIASYTAQVPETLEGGDSANSISGSFLQEGIVEISLSPDKKSIFSITKTDTGSSGIISGLEGENPKNIFSLPFSEWLTDWANEKIVFISSKPSFGIPGFIYMINTETKELSRVLGDIGGLTTLASPDGNKIAYSESFSVGNISFFIYNRTTGTKTEIGLSTLPEKCTWSGDSIYLYCAIPTTIPSVELPDMWYQGVVSFNDKLWKINSTDGTTEIISDLIKETGQFIDATKLFINKEGSHLFFINKVNETLWVVNL